MTLVAPLLDSPPLRRFGLPDLFRGSPPAAGADFTEKVDGQFLHRLITVRCKLVCSATVATRQVVLQYLDDAGGIYMENGASAGLAASETGWFVFSAFLSTDVYPAGAAALAPLAPTLLPPTYSWRLHITNVDTTDALTEVSAQRERFYTTNQPSTDVPYAGQ